MSYSHDLRERVLGAVARGERSQREIADDYEVILSFVERAWRRYRETGETRIKHWHHGQTQKLAGAGEEKLQRLLATQPDLRLAELCEQVKDKDGQAVSSSTMSRTLKRLGITHKKSSFEQPNKTRSG